jgi:murein DD-endopeptidase MepM/ murein hydrolase activator NlpD
MKNAESYGSAPSTPLPKAGSFGARAASAGTTTTIPGTESKTTSLDKAGFAQAQQQAAGARSIEGLFPGNKPGDQLLQEALAKAGREPTEQQFTSTSITKTPSGTFYTPAAGEAGHPGGYVHPLPGGTMGRTDMGQDMSAKPGTPIRAIGDSKVTGIYPNWYQGQPYVELEFLNGPRKGQPWYAAEQITPQVKQGQYVRGGHAIGYVSPQGTGLELGFGAHGGRTQAQAEGNTGGPSHENSPQGQRFTNFMKGLH